MTYQPIIGLEVHVELETKSKMFCGCPAEHFGVEPNTHTCPVCLGLPGALPVPNKKAIEWTILLGLALGCKINTNSKFDRKNYFYPDLPKGYQISQYDEPLCGEGVFSIQYQVSSMKKIRIRRVHLEEDTGKLQHAQVDGQKVSLVDFNRSGVPLVEIVTEPDFRSIEEVDSYLKELQKIIRYLGISGADMEKGSMRLEPSISIKPVTQLTSNAVTLNAKDLPKYRVELKNINSFRFARRALEFEIQRQMEMLDKGETPTQQTRGWSEAKNATVPQREKEEANDYRYFPEPDIPPMHFSKLMIEDLRFQISELPGTKKGRFIKEYGLSEYDAGLICEDKDVANYFEEAVKDYEKLEVSRKRLENMPKQLANWIINKKVEPARTVPADLVKLVMQASAVSQKDEKELEKIIDKVLLDNAKAVTDFRNGKIQAFGPLLGVSSQASGATIQQIKPILERKLNG